MEDLMVMEEATHESNERRINNLEVKNNKIVGRWIERIGIITITVVLTSIGSFYTLRTLANSSKIDGKAEKTYVDERFKDVKEDLKLLIQQNQAQHEDIMKTVTATIELATRNK
jgi:hypothetical protein